MDQGYTAKQLLQAGYSLEDCCRDGLPVKWINASFSSSTTVLTISDVMKNAKANLTEGTDVFSMVQKKRLENPCETNRGQQC